MDLQLQNQVAIVTGANRGIGYKIAENLAREGAIVAIFARTEERLLESAKMIQESSGNDPLVLVGDSKNKGDIEKAVQKTVDKFGKINILVNCMGGYTPSKFMELTDDDFMNLMETKWLGYIRAMRAVIPIMRQQKGGKILNIAGNSGKNPGFAHAGSVNAAVINITKVVSDEVAPDHILVNCIAPGITLTEHANHIIKTQAMKSNISYEESVKRTVAKIPLGVLGEPKDIAALATFLVSPVNGWINGTAISVDGGTNRSVFA